MKKITILVLSVFMFFVFYSCKSVESGAMGLYNQGQQSSSSLVLLKESFKNNQNNTVISGLSVDFVIDMLANGAEGKSLAQLEIFFNTSVEKKNAELQRKLQRLTPSLEISNSIWGNTFRESYKKLMEETFNLAVKPLPQNTSVINNWVSEKTHGRISSIFDPGPTNPLSLYLVNTVYFKDRWSQPFERENTREGRFYALSGETKRVKMMHREDNILYAQNAKVKSVRLPYKNGGWMSIYLPRNPSNFKEFIANVSEKDLNLDYDTQKVSLALPKFKMDSKTNVKQIFQSLGITEIFNSANDDLVKLSDAGAYVEDIRQRATIEVDEDGTVAAAATGVQALSKSIVQYIPFDVDRPFLFVVSEGDFVGVYTGDGE